MVSAGVFKYIALGMVIVGYGLRYWINARRFNRRNVAGLEEFSSYSRAGLVTLMERMGRGVGALLMIGGVAVVLVLGEAEKKNNKIIPKNHSTKEKR